MKFLQKLIHWERGKEVKEQENPSPMGLESAESKDKSIENIETFTRNKVLGCFLGLAIGDAKGMPAESQSAEYAQYIAETFDYVDGHLPKGHFTDDTHHSSILAESLIDKKGFDADDFMKKLAKLDLKRGIGPTTFHAIVKFINGATPAETGLPSPTNGPAMRIAPLAILYHYDLDLLRKYAIEASRVTHTSNESIGGALTVAFTIAYILNHTKEQFSKQNYMKELTEFVKPVSPELADSFREDAVLAERNGCRVMESVPHAVRIFMQDPYDFEKCIQQAIKGGGDADTIASIVGGFSGAFNGLDAIPAAWVERLENSEKGRDYMKGLAHKLYELSLEEKKKKSQTGSSSTL